MIDVVLPVHNEAASIAETLREFHRRVRGEGGVPIRLVVCEDGSSDGTLEILEALRKELPIRLITSAGRKGYSRAVIDGLRATTTDLVGVLDSDGQCDPDDFRRLLAGIGEHDLALGYRSPRSDPRLRLALSKAFKVLYSLLFPVRAKDPSCPYVLVRRNLLNRLLAGNIGVLERAFWWEFLARAVSENADFVEIPVRHRRRTAGGTRIYRLRDLPGIAAEEIFGLFRLKRELNSLFDRN